MEILAFLRESAGDYPCPGCQRSLADCGMELVEEEQGLYSVEVTCARCDLSFVVLLRVEVDEEMPVAAAVPPISADDLLDVHQVLRGHDGPLSELLAQA
ncbi:MAG: hypothetical protein NVSMB29_14950 [Candidatus Dormibacteria bacterium]